MKILINGKEVYIKNGTSFELTFDNRRFSGADSYSLTITFPMKERPENIAVFGHINRKDVRTGKAIYDCEIYADTLHLTGAVIIVEVNASEVKGQFLSGKSATNFHDDWDDVKINELRLSFAGMERQPQQNEGSTPAEWRLSIDDPDYIGLRLHWINRDSGVSYNQPDGEDSGWAHNQTANMHYLLHVVTAVFKAVGYTCDLSEIYSTDLRYLVLCNCVPNQASRSYRFLPDWSLTEFIEQLELFFRGEFNIDRIHKTARFSFYSNIDAKIPQVTLRNIVNEFTSEISKEDIAESDYIDMKNLAYADGGHELVKYWDCPWFIKSWQNRIVRYDYLEDMYKANAGYYVTSDTDRGPENKLLYAADADTYFILRTVQSYQSIGMRYQNVLQPVNIFGPRIVIDDDDAPVEEIKIVPACFDNRFNMYLSPQFQTDVDNELEDTYPLYETEEQRAERLSQTIAARVLINGKQEECVSLYDKLFVGFWDGKNGHSYAAPETAPTAFVCNYAPYAYMLNKPWPLSYMLEPMCDLLRLTSPRFAPMHHIDCRQKYTISFLSNTVPDPQAVFNINGRRYLCEKISVSVSEKGLSQLMKGVFYMIDE